MISFQIVTIIKNIANKSNAWARKKAKIKRNSPTEGGLKDLFSGHFGASLKLGNGGHSNSWTVRLHMGTVRVVVSDSNNMYNKFNNFVAINR